MIDVGDRATREPCRTRELHVQRCAKAREQREPATQSRRVDHEAKLIDETSSDDAPGEAGASMRKDGLAGLSLQLR